MRKEVIPDIVTPDLIIRNIIKRGTIIYDKKGRVTVKDFVIKGIKP